MKIAIKKYTAYKQAAYLCLYLLPVDKIISMHILGLNYAHTIHCSKYLNCPSFLQFTL